MAYDQELADTERDLAFEQDRVARLQAQVAKLKAAGKMLAEGLEASEQRTAYRDELAAWDDLGGVGGL